jgi:hypothetical protein
MKEYMTTLNTRSKWLVNKRDFAVDDILIMADENDPKRKWPLARVMEAWVA